jgi:hypothetical protein
MQLLGENAIRAAAAPQRAPNFDRQQRDLPAE